MDSSKINVVLVNVDVARRCILLLEDKFSMEK